VSCRPGTPANTETATARVQVFHRQVGRPIESFRTEAIQFELFEHSLFDFSDTKAHAVRAGAAVVEAAADVIGAADNDTFAAVASSGASEMKTASYWPETK
jgi:hypothetical protein